MIRSSTIDAVICGARRLPPRDRRRLRRHARPRGGDQRRARSQERASVPGPRPAAGRGSSSRSSTRPRRAGSSTWPSATRSHRHAALHRRVDAAGRGRRRQHQPDPARQGQPRPSAVYALGAVRLRQRLRPPAPTHDVQLAPAQARRSRTSSTRSGSSIPLRRVDAVHRHRRRRALRGRADPGDASADDGRPRSPARRVPRVLRRRSSAWTRSSWSSASGCRRPRPRRWCPRCSSTATLLAETRRARRHRARTRRCAPGCVARYRPSPSDGRRSRTSSARCWPAPRRWARSTASTRAHGRHVALLAARLFDELRDEHGLGGRDRLLLQVAALLHDVGIYVSLRGAPQALAVPARGVADLRPVRRRDGDRRQHRPLPPARRCRSESHLPYMALDRDDRLRRQQAGGDPARRQRARRRAPAEGARRAPACAGATPGSLELDGSGDLTMERLAATARADMFAEVFGRELVIRAPGVAA